MASLFSLPNRNFSFLLRVSRYYVVGAGSPICVVLVCFVSCLGLHLWWKRMENEDGWWLCRWRKFERVDGWWRWLPSWWLQVREEMCSGSQVVRFLLVLIVVAAFVGGSRDVWFGLFMVVCLPGVVWLWEVEPCARRNVNGGLWFASYKC